MNRDEAGKPLRDVDDFDTKEQVDAISEAISAYYEFMEAQNTMNKQTQDILTIFSSRFKMLARMDLINFGISIVLIIHIVSKEIL